MVLGGIYIIQGAMSYRPISLLCIPLEILEKLSYVRVEPKIDSLLSHKKADFQHGRSTVDLLSYSDFKNQTENKVLIKKKT